MFIKRAVSLRDTGWTWCRYEDVVTPVSVPGDSLFASVKVEREVVVEVAVVVVIPAYPPISVSTRRPRDISRPGLLSDGVCEE
jgi:hypothetical protein